MAVKLEFKGRDVDEAVKAACKKFGVDRDVLNIDIVSTGSTGIFGLMRQHAVVRACLKKEESAGNNKETKKPAEKKKHSKPKAKAAARAPQEKSGQDEEEKPEEEKRKPRRQKVEPSPVPPEYHEQLISELNTLLSLMGMESDIVIGEENGKTKLEITGDHVEALQERDGQALDGLQYLLRKMTSDKLPERAMFVVDAGDFRANRRKELQELAVRLADEVKEKSVTRTIPPLNPSERRIVHMMLQDDTTIRSRSVGSGLFKKILIYKPGTQRRRTGRKRGNRSRTPRK
ncbi:MAG: Jag N-terminal domain-containing protein [Thermodesulfobacteriota bacterium]